MHVGIFGDSFMQSYDGQDYGYPNLIKQYLQQKNIDSSFLLFSKQGSSHWYSYTNFLKNYKDCDIIIFGHTSRFRWPALPLEFVDKSYIIRKEFYRDNTPQIIKDINKYYFDIMPEDFTRFISEQIFYNINKICKEENKYLINFQLFATQHDDIKYSNTIFPVLQKLNLVSTSEKVCYKGKLSDMDYIVNKICIPDPRACHLSKANNKILADYLIKLMLEKPYNITVDLTTELQWQDHDSHTEDLLVDLL